MTDLFPFEFSPLAALFFGASLAWIAFELRYNLFWRPKGKHRVSGSGTLNMAATASALVLSMVCWQMAWGYGYPDDARRILAAVGTTAMAAGMALRYSVAWTLGRLFTMDITILEDHRIVRTGPFRVVRHPGYLGTYLTALGFAVAMGSYLAVLGAAAVLFTVYSRRIRAEEELLVREFGDDYVAYQRDTKRLIPFVY